MEKLIYSILIALFFQFGAFADPNGGGSGGGGPGTVSPKMNWVIDLNVDLPNPSDYTLGDLSLIKTVDDYTKIKLVGLGDIDSYQTVDGTIEFIPYHGNESIAAAMKAFAQVALLGEVDNVETKSGEIIKLEPLYDNSKEEDKPVFTNFLN